MVDILKTLHPIARKEHTCMFCGEKILPGQKYNRATCLYDSIYDWIAHEECVEVAHKLDMFDDCDDSGLDGERFLNELNDVLEDRRLSPYDKVRKILEERRK